MHQSSWHQSSPNQSSPNQSFSRRAFVLAGTAAVCTASCRSRGEDRVPLRVLPATKRFGGGGVDVTWSSWARGVTSGTLILASAPAFTVVPSATLQTTLEFGLADTRNGFAVNGGFYDENNVPMGVVRHRGKDTAPRTARGGSGIIAMTSSGARLFHRDDEIPADASEALQSIDRLVVDGRSVVGQKARPDLDARAAVGIAGDTIRVAVIFDDRAAIAQSTSSPSEIHLAMTKDSTSTGVSLADFATLLAAPTNIGGCGMTAALNLDGGYSVGCFMRLGDDVIRIDPYRATINAVRL